MQIGEGIQLSLEFPGNELCIFCRQNHKENKEEKLPEHTFQRNDETLTSSGRTFIKADSERLIYYPRDDVGNFVSPLEAPEWSQDTIFNTYRTKSGQVRKHAAGRFAIQEDRCKDTWAPTEKSIFKRFGIVWKELSGIWQRPNGAPIQKKKRIRMH